MGSGGGFQNVLVIGADGLSRFVDWTDRGSCILFGDAAGAVLVQVILYPSASYSINDKYQLSIWIVFSLLLDNDCLLSMFIVLE